MATRQLAAARLRALDGKSAIHARSGRRWFARALVVSAALALGVLIALLHTRAPAVDAAPASWELPEPRCRLSDDEASMHARSLEALADARWQRVPFALREGPRARLEMAEAEACYEAAGDRAGRRRCESKLRGFEAELARRWAQVTLQRHACAHGHLRVPDVEACLARSEALAAVLDSRAPTGEGEAVP